MLYMLSLFLLCFRCFLFSVGPNDILNQSMSYDVSPRQLNIRNTLDSPKRCNGFHHAAFLALFEVNLCYVTSYYHFGAVPQSCQDHKHLQGRGVLGLVTDDSSFV